MDDGSTRTADAATPTQLRELRERARANPDVVGHECTRITGGSVPDPTHCPAGHAYYLAEMLSLRPCHCGLTHVAADCRTSCGLLFYPALQPGCGPPESDA
jgi:hypothetical protein